MNSNKKLTQYKKENGVFIKKIFHPFKTLRLRKWFEMHKFLLRRKVFYDHNLEFLLMRCKEKLNEDINYE